MIRGTASLRGRSKQKMDSLYGLAGFFVQPRACPQPRLAGDEDVEGSGDGDREDQEVEHPAGELGLEPGARAHAHPEQGDHQDGRGLGAATSRASAGAIEWLPVSRVANLPRALESLKSEGFWVVGADAEAGPSLFEVSDRVLQGDLVVVLGSEGRGLRPLVRRLVDHPVRIPMQGRIASLNVATASAVILFELLRRSQPSADSSISCGDEN